jgi:hypothetical protein
MRRRWRRSSATRRIWTTSWIGCGPRGLGPGPVVIDLHNINSKTSPQSTARLAQLAERKALNLVVVGSTPTSGETFLALFSCFYVVTMLLSASFL